MTLSELKESIEEYVLLAMREYLEPTEDDEAEYDDDGEEISDAPYTAREVNLCGVMLEKFIDELEDCEQDEKKIRKCVKSVVLKLNKLNERTDFALIETDQREAICEFIVDAVNAAGLETEDDITEEWREW